MFDFRCLFSFVFGHHDERVDEMRLRLWAEAISRPVVHLPGDIWAWKTVVEWCRHRKTPYSSTRACCQFCQQIHLVARKRNIRRKLIWPCEVFFHTRKWYLYDVKSYDLGPYFTSSPKEGRLQNFTALKHPSPQPGLNPRTLGLIARTLTITSPRLLSLEVVDIFFSEGIYQRRKRICK
jgi:hypothetical protein